jgi:hypothetical protein
MRMTEGNTGEGDPSLKGKGAVSKDTKQDAQPKGCKRLCKSSMDRASKRASPEKITLFDELEGDLLLLIKRKKPAPRRYIKYD